MAVREVKVLFSTIAKPGMFGLVMVPKEGFLAYSTQFIFLIIRFVPGNHWYVLKEPHYGGVDIWNYVKTCISFHVFRLLFVCLIIFLHFYICNVWVISANKNFSFYFKVIFTYFYYRVYYLKFIIFFTYKYAQVLGIVF